MNEMIASQFKQQKFENSWMNNLKSDAWACFSALGFPTLKNEEWKYTNVEAISRLPFDFSSIHASTLRQTQGSVRMLGQILSPSKNQLGARLVFVNGMYSKELSQTENLPSGIRVGSIAEFIQKEPDLIQQHLSKYSSYQKQAFVALNTAFISEGAFIFIPQGVVLENPIEVLYVSESEEMFVAQPRNLIIAEKSSQASIVEHYIGKDSIYFMNAVTEIHAADSAVIEHIKVQEESEKAYHVFSLGVQQERQSHVTSYSISLGAALSRHDLNSVLNAEGSECVMNGLYLTFGSQHVDHHTVIDHAQPHCMSQELYKGILADRSRGVFNGKVIVRPHAIKTNSSQSNKNLLLSDEAEIDTEPLLEIFNNDVKCSHGATTGHLDPKQIFYLRSRGISEDFARSMLTYAFAGEVIDKLKIPSLRGRLQQNIFDRLMKNNQGRIE